MTNLKDIENREDVEFLVDEFYKQVVKDDVIGFFFTHIVELNFEKHIPVMYDFWETTLLGKMKYKGNPMVKHIELNNKEPLTAKHFERWLQLWEETLSEHFNGLKAQEALKRAKQIGELMKFKVQHQTTNRTQNKEDT